MKKLSIFFIKSFVGPFLATFFISMFMLIMQFLWKYIDDLMGKGLEISIIIELLFYVSASLLPLALPLAILLSSLIVMGNLGESNELTALKSSGLSIYKILKPLTAVVIFIAIGTFYFSNYIIPIANYKWHSIIYDIQEKKMTSFLKPGAYTQEIDGFSIKIKEKDGNSFTDIIIHDRRNSAELKTIRADAGELYQSDNGEFLYFKLFNGDVIEELKNAPSFQGSKKNSKSIFPGRKTDFKTATYKLDMSGFKLQRSKEEMFKDDYEMLNVFQIDETVDSLRKNFDELSKMLRKNTLTKHPYFQAKNYLAGKEPTNNKYQNIHSTKELIEKSNEEKNQHKKKTVKQTPAPKKVDSSKLIFPVFKFSEMSDEKRKGTFNHMNIQLENNIKTLNGQLDIIKNRHRQLRKFEIEFHRKFALSFSIIILFFVGAPLGAIVKKGGFGAPVVIAALLFMVYFVLITIGDGMADGGIIPPSLGMWGPNIILTPIALLLLKSAANDKSFVAFPNIFKRFKRKKDTND